MGNEGELIKDVVVKDPSGSSDHNMTEFQIQFEDENPGVDNQCHQRSKVNYSGKVELPGIDWVNRPMIGQWMSCGDIKKCTS